MSNGRLALALSVLVLHGLGAGSSDLLLTSGTPDPAQLHAWYDASDGVNGPGTPADQAAVTLWTDRSGNGRDLSPPIGALSERPVFRAQLAGAHPALHFGGDDVLLASAAQDAFGTLAGPKTIFVAARVHTPDGGYVFDGTTSAGRNAFFTGQSGAAGRWVLFAGQNPVTVGPPVDAGVFQVHSLLWDTAGQAHFLNGELVGFENATLWPLAGFVLGARFNLAQRLVGDVAEVLIYDRVLSNPERAQIEGYLLEKYPESRAPEPPASVDVFTTGDGLYPAYRIPAIVTTQAGTVLAFAEGRQSLSDHAQNDIVMRRSADGGSTWGPVVVLHDDGPNSLNNPCVVEVRVGPHAGRVLLQYQRYPNGCHTNCVVPGYTGSDICRSFQMHSDDDGLTWSAPLENTSQVKRPTLVTSIASGPGVGIQKRHAPHAGRLVMPYNQGPTGDWKVYVVYSDDGGDTWVRGDVADDSQTQGDGNEVQVVERVDGALLLNARGAGGTRHRKVALSFDGGATWSPLADDLDLIEPQVMASVLRYTDPLDGFGADRVLYAGPLSTVSRTHGHVHLSYDGGDTWPVNKLVYPGFYAYSVLTVIDPRTIGVLFERDGYGFISLARFDLDWLTDGADCLLPAQAGERYCDAAPNSAGPGAFIGAQGTTSVTSSDLILTAEGLPAGVPGLFYYGPGALEIPFGEGVRCVSGAPQVRLTVTTANATGELAHQVDFADPINAAQLTPGTTWNFQVWYRDQAGGPSGFNLSDGLRLRLCP